MSKKLLIAAAMGAAMMLMLPGCSSYQQPNSYVTYESASSTKLGPVDHCGKMRVSCCKLIKKYGCKGMDMDGCKRIARSSCKGPLAMSGCERMLNSCGVRLPCCVKAMEMKQ